MSDINDPRGTTGFSEPIYSEPAADSSEPAANYPSSEAESELSHEPQPNSHPQSAAALSYASSSFSAPLPIVDASASAVLHPQPRRRRRGLFWVAVLCAAVMTTTGSVIAVVTYLDEAKPGGVARQYFAAIARGDAAGALSFGSIPAGSRALLTEPVLKAQLAIGQVSEVAVLAETKVGRDMRVDLQYALTVAGRLSTITDTIVMVPHGRTWRLETSVVPVQVAFSGAASRTSVIGATVPMGSQLMFPGATPFTFDTKNLELTGGSSVIRFSSTPSPFAVQLSLAGTKAVSAGVDAALTACLTGKAPAQALCPAIADTRAVPGSLRGTITSALSNGIKLAVSDSPDGVILASGDVPVTGNYDQLDFNNLAASMAFNGTIRVLTHVLVSKPDAITWGGL